MRPTRTSALAAALLVAAGVSAAYANAQPSTEPSPAPAPSETPAPDGQPSAEAAPPGPKTTIDADGTYAVGKDIVPGVYSSAGPIPSGTACYWKRAAGDELLDNALTKKPAVVQILANDSTFTTNDCQTWALTPNAPLPRQAGPGDLLSQLAPLIGSGILNGGASGPPAAGSAPARSAPAAEAPAAEAPVTETPTEHIPATGAAPGPG
ncbi:MAG: hypothetical protein K2X52_11755 [Mycobacteriaceae bacterium]|nr:hypothetical protein [Mycobacteriaceae bacterium]